MYKIEKILANLGADASLITIEDKMKFLISEGINFEQAKMIAKGDIKAIHSLFDAVPEIKSLLVVPTEPDEDDAEEQNQTDNLLFAS